MMKCTESEAYLQASYYAYKMEPTAEAATGCAYQAFKKGDIDGAVKFFDEAVNLETDNVKKAEKHTLPQQYWLLPKSCLKQEHIARKQLVLTKTTVLHTS